MKHTKNMIYKVSDASNELFLYAVNESRLYHGMIQSIIQNLSKKMSKCIYDSEKAVDLYYYAATEAAQMYDNDFGLDNEYTFTVTDRYTVAVEMEEYYRGEVEFKAGNQDLTITVPDDRIY